MRHKENPSLLLLIFVLSFVLFVYIANEALSLPVVQIDSATGKCISVISIEHYTCDALPDKYSAERVAPR